MKKQPRVLVLSRNSWNDTNNSGNTLSNLFQNWKSENIANLYCRDEIPNNSICTNYFKISESTLIQKLLGKNSSAGQRHGVINVEYVSNNEIIEQLQEKERKRYNFFRKNRWHLFLWFRELLWKVTPWKSAELLQFLNDFKPEIIYSQSYDSFYMHSLLYFLRKNSNAKIVYFHCDDLVTYRQFSLSPFYWVNRIILRQYMNKSILLAHKNYCIIDEQARVYESIYNRPFDLLYKAGNFDSQPEYKVSNSVLKLVYTGNVIYGRINTLIAIANALMKINAVHKKAELFIYTANIIEEKDKKQLLRTKSVHLMGKVAYQEIPAILQDASVLIHVESFEKQQKFATALSFSTKLVDYFEAGKPIFAVGWRNSASIIYLKKNNLGFTVTNLNDIQNAIHSLIDTSPHLNTMGSDIWDFGKKHMNKKIVLPQFEKQLQTIK